MLGKTCRLLSHNPQKISQYHRRLGGKKYAGIDLKWEYEKTKCQVTMDGYILELRNKYGHITPETTILASQT